MGWVLAFWQMLAWTGPVIIDRKKWVKWMIKPLNVCLHIYWLVSVSALIGWVWKKYGTLRSRQLKFYLNNILYFKIKLLLSLLIMIHNNSVLVVFPISPIANLLFSAFIVCDLVSLGQIHADTKTRKKNWHPPGSGCHDSPCLLLLIEHIATASTPAHLIPLGYWFCEWSGQTPRWQYWYMLGGQGGVNKPSCPCILCRPLSSSPPNACVMAYLYTIIRKTHTYALTVKSHQNKTHKQG